MENDLIGGPVIDPLQDEIAQEIVSNLTQGLTEPKLGFPFNILMFFWRMFVQFMYMAGTFVIFTIFTTWYKQESMLYVPCVPNENFRYPESLP